MPRQQRQSPRQLAQLVEALQADPDLLDRLIERQAEPRATKPPRRTGERRTAQHAVADLAGIRSMLIDREDDGIAKLAEHLRANPTADWSSIGPLLDRIVSNRQREQVLAELQGKNERAAEATRVHNEPPPYAPDSPHSWAADLFTVSDPTISGLPSERVSEAEDRLAKHAKDVAQASKGSGDYAKHVKGVFRDRTRRDDPELHRRLADEAEREFAAVAYRSTGTGGGATATASSQAAAFVPPAFVLSAWAPFRGEGRPFAEQCKKMPLPDYGLQIYVPFWSSTDKVAKQSEGSAITESSPAAELEGSGTVATLAGVVDLTTQLHDRGYTGGGSFDTEFAKELGERLARETEKEVFARAIEQGEQVTGEASYSNKGLYKDLALAREKLTDTAGTRLRPTHLFTTSDQYFYSSRQVDATTERPLWQPWFAPGFPLPRGSDSFDGELDPQWSRFTGTVLPDGMLWFTSEMVPADGTTTKTKLIVSAPEIAICLFEGTPTYEVLPWQYANELKVVARLRNYVGIVTRHKAGTAYVNNCNAYVTTNV